METIPSMDKENNCLHNSCIKETMECPFGHWFVINGGLTCCHNKTSKPFPSQYIDPKSKCRDWIDCPDQIRKCRNNEEAPG